MTEHEKHLEVIAKQQQWLILLFVILVLFLVVAIVLFMGVLWWLDTNNVMSQIFEIIQTVSK